MDINKIKQIGASGEALAVNFLKNKKFKVISRNFHSCYGEIDIIAIDEDELVFVEVKTRASNIETALSSISRSKQKKLFKTAATFLASHQQYEDWFTRFDVIIIINAENTKERKIKHLKNAFSAI